MNLKQYYDTKSVQHLLQGSTSTDLNVIRHSATGRSKVELRCAVQCISYNKNDMAALVTSQQLIAISVISAESKLWFNVLRIFISHSHTMLLTAFEMETQGILFPSKV